MKRKLHVWETGYLHNLPSFNTEIVEWAADDFDRVYIDGEGNLIVLVADVNDDSGWLVVARINKDCFRKYELVAEAEPEPEQVYRPYDGIPIQETQDRIDGRIWKIPAEERQPLTLKRVLKDAAYDLPEDLKYQDPDTPLTIGQVERSMPYLDDPPVAPPVDVERPDTGIHFVPAEPDHVPGEPVTIDHQNDVTVISPEMRAKVLAALDKTTKLPIIKQEPNSPSDIAPLFAGSEPILPPVPEPEVTEVFKD